MDADELTRRIGAGLRLRGITQVELGEMFKADGLGKEAPGRIQRGDLGMQRVHLDAFCRHLELPPSWFTAEDPLASSESATSVEVLSERIEEMYEVLLGSQGRLLGELGKVQAELEVLRGSSQRRDRRTGDVGSG